MIVNYLLVITVMVAMIVLSSMVCKRWNVLKKSDDDGNLAIMLTVQLSVYTGSRVVCIILEVTRILTLDDHPYVDDIFSIVVMIMLYMPNVLRPLFYVFFCPILRVSFTATAIIFALAALIPDGILLDDARLFLGEYLMCAGKCSMGGVDTLCSDSCHRQCLQYLDMRVWRL